MRAVMLLVAAWMMPSIAMAETAPAPELSIFASSTEIQALISRAEASIKPGQPSLSQPLLQFAPYRAVLEYRRAVTKAAIHKDDAELFYVVQGGGTLIQGGALVDPIDTDAHNVSGTAIAGGSARRVAAGDMLVVPAGTPHWFSAIDGRLVMVAIKLPQVSAGH